MELTFLGAAHEVTGSCALLTVGGKKILIDCGMEQGKDTYLNADIPVIPAELDCILLTHAHIDHSGKLPLLRANGFGGKIYSTEATRRLCEIMLMDSAHIQEFEATWRNRKAKRSGSEEYTPLYTTEDAAKTLPLFVGCGYDRQYNILDGVSIRFIEAGHLMGSSSIEITVTENGETKVIVFSGDLGNTKRPLIRDPEQPQEADIVVIESTYGDRLHGERPDYVSRISEIIQETFDKGGNVVIPSFAVGRTQELLYYIRIIKEKGLVKNHGCFKVYMDSPLAIEATRIYSDKEEIGDYYDSETLELLKNGVNPISFDGLVYAVSSDDSKLINADKAPKVIISASGMCEAGRIRHHLKHNLWREESTILFVGYQAVGTLGRAVADGVESVKLFGEEVQVNARIVTLEGISGHADKNMLLDWIGSFKRRPDKIFVNHGNDLVCDEFAKKITENFGIEAEAPYSGGKYDLISGACLCRGNMKHIEKVDYTEKRKPSGVFERLALAGRRLLLVIDKNKDCANKDIAKFTDQLIALCDKWDRS